MFCLIGTVLVKVQSDILLNIDQQKVSQLVLIDLSSAFDTVDHDILLNIMSCTFGVSGTALSLFKSYHRLWCAATVLPRSR